MKAFLVVDIHRYFDWYREQIEKDKNQKPIALAMKARLAEARKANEIIVFAMWPGGCDGQAFQISKNGKCIGCDNGDPLAEFLGHRHECEPVFYKNSYDAFTNKALAKHLRSKEVTEIILLGCNTDACVLETARGALEAGFDVTLLADCTYPPFRDENDQYHWLEQAKTIAAFDSENRNTVQVQ